MDEEASRRFEAHDREVLSIREKLAQYEREGLRADKSMMSVLAKIQVSVERVETKVNNIIENDNKEALETKEYRNKKELEFDNHCLKDNNRLNSLEAFKVQITTGFAILTAGVGLAFEYLKTRG